MRVVGGRRDSESGSLLEVPACTSSLVTIMCLPTPGLPPTTRAQVAAALDALAEVNESLWGHDEATRATSMAETDREDPW
jgi:hypothetical protein